MKNFRKLLATITLMAVIVISASTVKAGILMTDDFTTTEQICTENKTRTTSFDWGVIVQGIKGIIVQGYTGVIVQDVVNKNLECGVVVQG